MIGAIVHAERRELNQIDSGQVRLSKPDSKSFYSMPAAASP
jgi:hypothetical protein